MGDIDRLTGTLLAAPPTLAGIGPSDGLAAFDGMVDRLS